MEVLVGPTFGVASSAATFVRDRPQEKISSSSCLFLKEDDVVGGADDPTGDGSGSDRGSPELSSDSSSSIGVPGDSSDEEEDEDGVVSSGPSLGLASLSSIEDSLPIKRGLSNHYAGKSKSFASLSDISSVSSVKDLQKPENPFNKRRRVLIANKWARKSFYSWQNPNSMPLLAALNEDDEDGDDKENPSSSSSSSSPSSSSLSSNDKLSVAAAAAAAQKPKLQQSKLRATFKSQSCFSLTDLQVEHQ